jgi:preprotein translocase subunit SecE
MASTSEASQQANRSGIDPKRLVIIFYLVSGVILALFMEHLLSTIWAQFGLPDPEFIEGLQWRATTLLGVILSVVAVIVCYLHPRIHRLSLEVASELMKVTWPSWAETRVSTVAVVVASLVAAIILFAIDSLAYKIMVSWLPALWGRL